MAPRPLSHTTRLRERAARAGWAASAPFRRAGNLVLTYHRVSTADDPFPHLDVATFRRHLEWLGRHCDVIAPDRWRQAASASRSSRPSVLLTFDDGYRSFHDVVAPLLREFGMPGVVFVITSYADEPRPLPWDRLYLAVERGRVRRIALPWAPERQVTLEGPRRNEFIHACQRHFARIPAGEQARTREAIIDALDPPAFELPRQTMTWDEVRATRDIALAGAHTHTHPRLSTIATDQVDDEIRLSRDRLLAETGVPPTFFAYPHGDSAASARAPLARYGFDTAFTTVPGVNDGATDWLAANRVGIGEILPTRWMTTHLWTLTTR